MDLCVLSFLVFAAGLLLQVAVWRARVPAHPTTTLLWLFGGWLALCLAIIEVTRAASALGLETWIDYGRLLLFYVPAVLAYVCFYSSIDGESPSIMMLELTREAGEQGCALHDYRKVVNDDLLVGSRIQGMVNGGLAVLDEDSLELTRRGHALASLFQKSHRMLALRDGG